MTVNNLIGTQIWNHPACLVVGVGALFEELRIIAVWLLLITYGNRYDEIREGKGKEDHPVVEVVAKIVIDRTVVNH